MSLRLPALTTLVAVLLYVVTLANVAFARAKYKVVAPAVSGNPDFERIFRVQMNTLEQLVAFLPALWLFALYIWPRVVVGNRHGVDRRACLLCVARRAADKRGPGAVTGFAALVVLWAGALWGVVGALVRG